jgi:hypothetical protein
LAGEHWTDEPEAQDFPAAESYLSLLVGPAAAAKLVKALRKVGTLHRYAVKDKVWADRHRILQIWLWVLPWAIRSWAAA